jgi:endonuclease G
MRKYLLLTILTFCLYEAYSQSAGLTQIDMFTYGGLPMRPVGKSEVKILPNWSYIVGYDEQYKNPLWVAYRLGNMKGAYDFKNWERPDRFIPDRRTTTQIDHEAYTSSGYQRGHMAPNATMLSQYGQMAQLETYLTTNICPQTSKLNQNLWSALEKLERETISQDDTPNKEIRDVFVITGPVFSAKPDTLKSGVAVPVSFYRILAYRRGYLGTVKTVTFLLPQQPKSTKLTDYLTTVDEIERLTHLNFFSELSEVRQHNLESKKRNIQLEDL